MTDDPTKRLHEDLFEEPDNSVKGLFEWDEVKSMPHSDFIRNPPLRFSIPESFVGLEMDFTLVVDDEYQFSYAVVLRHSKTDIETHFLTYWRKSNKGGPAYYNKYYGLPKDVRWCDTDKRARDDRDINYIRAALEELGHNTSERF